MQALRKSLLLAVALATTLSLAAARPCAAQPTPVDLGVLPEGVGSRAIANNGLGQVIGTYNSSSSPWTHGFIWLREPAYGLPAGMTDLGNLGGAVYLTYPYAINDSGQVVGHTWIPVDEAGHGVERAFLWQNGAMTDLGTLSGASSNATDINAAGQVVGWAATAYWNRAFLYTPGGLDGELTNPQMKDLGTLPGHVYSHAIAINDVGQVLCSSGNPDDADRAFVWQDGTITDLETLGGYETRASAMNQSGQVVGYSEAEDGMPHAFVWDSVKKLRDLNDALGYDLSFASAINESGQVVGYGITMADGVFHAFLWDPVNGATELYASATHYPSTVINDSGQVAITLYDLATEAGHGLAGTVGNLQDVGTLGGTQTALVAINDSGEIVGVSTLEGDQVAHAVIVTLPGANTPPVLDVSAAPPYGVVGVPITFTATASDPDIPANTLTFSLVGAPAGAGIDPASGAFTWTPAAGGTAIFDVTVSDGNGGSDTKSVTVNVSALDISVASVARNGKTVTVTVTLTNRGTATANNVTVTAAQLDGSSSNSPLPLLYGSIKPGTSKASKLQFKSVDWSNPTLTVNGTCSLGPFFMKQTVIAP